MTSSATIDPVARRRTFAIISHPDAGKTTLTEKLLLFGGAIQLAGEVRAKANRRQTRSDWMGIEKERGISVVTSGITFEYGDCVYNLLDTPGHEDFSEDTYRTLTAVDSAIMVLDARRGRASSSRCAGCATSRSSSSSTSSTARFPMKALDRLSSGSSWTDETTRVALSIVWRHALLGRTITYGDLDKQVKKEGFKGAIPITYRYVAGKIGDVCELLAKDLNKNFPPLNLVIINERTFLPSEGVDGYLSRFLKMEPGEIERLSAEARDAYALEAKESALSFDGWEAIGKALKLGKAFPPPVTTVSSPLQLPSPTNFQRGIESEAHKRLKDWVANHPEAFRGLGVLEKGKLERELASGDRLDVLFEGSTMLAVEVKAANAHRDEIERGVFQCVKYAATMRAMQAALHVQVNARAVLVLEAPAPHKIKELAFLLNISIFTKAELAILASTVRGRR